MEQPTLRTLLQRPDLQLRLVSRRSDLAPTALDRPVRWIHSSDLQDPTPFLSDDLVLLTTGTQFADDDPVAAADYLRRLTERGVAALGFGTEVFRAGIPGGLVAACAQFGMPLFEVPYDTPFIAVTRAHAEAIAAQAFARRAWALDAQRALAVAALRRRPLASAIAELSRRLGHWVGLFDSAGELVLAHPAQPPTPPVVAELTARAAELVSFGGQTAQQVHIGGADFTVFTIGRGGHLRGVIAIGGSLDPDARAVVTSVIAMAGLALEQGQQLTRARRRLGSQLLESLLLDDPSLARRVTGALPAAPILVGVMSTEVLPEVADEWWDSRFHDQPQVAFVADSGAGIVAVVPVSRTELFDQFAAHFGVRVGVSDPTDYHRFSRANAQARAALRANSGTLPPGAIRYGDIVQSHSFAALATDAARLAAQSRLAPLAAHHDLEHSIRVWLDNDARIEAAAGVLGVHRHTLRTRIATAAELLGVDLASFPARAALWADLQLVGPAQS